ncbi:MAG: kynureninase [Bacteroidetes bacterium]|nr:kynureninase [Bacteroidota bacterium]
MNFQNTIAFAQQLDADDELKQFRESFYIPMMYGKEAIYFTGNSLGLQPKATQDYVLNELEDWASLGVEGHFHARHPWMPYHEIFPNQLSKVVGCLPNEVVVMNQLTVNLHLLMVSFYQPTKVKYKIICEAKAFPSDQYALESQVKFHGFDYDDAVIEVAPREGEYNIRTEDILQAIEQHKDSLALVLFGGVNYYTGQVFDIKSITAAAHKVGVLCGFDLAHAAGNIELHLHDWEVDFACWCSYKYLNSGPGGVAGVYIHEKHATNTDLQRFAGWWGYEKETRFKMDRGFKAIPTAEGWQLSNAPILSMAAHKAALDIVEEAGMDRLHTKRKLLNAYLWYVVDEVNKAKQVFEIITPRNEAEHGCQISLLTDSNGKQMFDALTKKGVITDWREPNVTRIAPVPLYNSFEDVWQFGNIVSGL